ncbi:MAG: histidinol dehydrogenase [Coriobacteriaceae bacterium]|nr:histidinol dehydrogenase [Coriobacteriaceae bacterium]
MRKVILNQGEVFSNSHLQRKSAFNAKAMQVATQIVEDVRERGDECLRELTEKFDGVRLENFRVSQEKFDAAVAACEPQLAKALEQAADQIREFHERQLEQSWFSVREDGALVGAKVTPLDSVGVYVPGGRALYPSTLLMNALPASVAGVPRIVVANPPLPDGGIDPAIAKACQLAGVTEIYQVGGAQAVAALAYGTEQIAPVDKITGPGNAFVAAAKKIVSGDVGIDMIAGPSEVCVVADETAEPSLVAIDLMAQAEHDPLATCYLVAFSEAYADAVLAAIDEHVKESTRADITTASLDDQGLIVVCQDLPQAIEAVNVIAPEHLELHIANPMDSLGAIRHAGAIFLGEWTPEAVGDYVAGPNHTLPTGGTARFSSPLAVEQFIKKSSVIQYSQSALMADAPAIVAIAKHEGLWAHARSVELRMEQTL